LKDATPDEYEALLERFGVVLDADERAFLTTPSPRTLSDSELAGAAGGVECACEMYVHSCEHSCCSD